MESRLVSAANQVAEEVNPLFPLLLPAMKIGSVVTFNSLATECFASQNIGTKSHIKLVANWLQIRIAF